MSKIKPKISHKLMELIRCFGRDVFETDGAILLCKVCCTKVAFDRKAQVEQRVATKKNVEAIATRKVSQTHVSRIQDKPANSALLSDTFSQDLTLAMTSANIPLYKMQNERFRAFLERYCGRKVLDESTLRKNYTLPLYNSTLT